MAEPAVSERIEKFVVGLSQLIGGRSAVRLEVTEEALRVIVIANGMELAVFPRMNTRQECGVWDFLDEDCIIAPGR